jgi:hypothetical protein
LPWSSEAALDLRLQLRVKVRIQGMNEQQLPTNEPSIENQPQIDPAEAVGAAVSLHADRPGRPAGVPEKFWSAEDGAVRTDALLKSYLELERKLGTMVPLPVDDGDDEGQKRLRRALGVPESADAYRTTSFSSPIRKSMRGCTTRDLPKGRRSWSTT